MAAPLGKEWASSEIFCVRFKRCPYIDEHILSAFFDASFNSCRDAVGVLADNFEAAQDCLA